MADIAYGAKGSDMKFKYVDPLKNNDIADLKLPQKLVKFLAQTNAGSPESRTLIINNKDYIFNNVLNFNSDAKLEGVREYVENLGDKLECEIPFGRDGFGNVYLVDLDSLMIRFYDYENEIKSDLCPFDEFVNMLGLMHV